MSGLVHTCDKKYCEYCRLTVNNEGRASEAGLLKLGLVQKEKPVNRIFLNAKKKSVVIPVYLPCKF